MRAILLLSMRNIRSNLVKHLSMGVLYTLVCVLAVSGIALAGSVRQARMDLLRKQSQNTQVSITSKRDERFAQGDLVRRIGQLEGVAHVAPYLDDQAWLVGDDYVKLQVVGTDLVERDETFPFRLIEGSRSKLSEGDAAVVTEEFAKDHHLGVSSRIEAKTATGGRIALKVAAITASDPDYVQPNLVYVPIAAARALFRAGEDEVSSIGVNLDDMRGAEQFAARIKGELPDTLAGQAAYSEEGFERGVTSVSVIVGIMTLFGTLVALYLSYSVFRTLICGRLRQVGVIRCLGFLRRDVYLAYLVEYHLVAIPASLLGLALSVPTLKRLTSIVSAGELSVSPTVVLGPWLLVLGFVLVSPLPVLLLVRARSSSGVVELMAGGVERHAVRPLSSIGIALVSAVVCGALGVLASMRFAGRVALSASFLLEAAAMLIAFQLCVWLFVWLADVLFSLARGRRSVALCYLAEDNWRIGHSAVLVAIAVGISVFCLDIGGLIHESTRSVCPNTDIMATISDETGKRSAESVFGDEPHITRAVRLDDADVEMEGDDLKLSGVDPAAYAPVASGPLDGDAGKGFGVLHEAGSIIVSQGFAEEHGLAVGDTARITWGGATSRLRIVATIRSFDNLGRVAFMEQQQFRSRFIPSRSTFLLNIDDPDEAAAVARNLQARFEGVATCGASPIGDLLKENDKENQPVYAIAYAIDALILAVVIVGLMDNTVMEIMAKCREFAIRRAIGQPFRSIMGGLLSRGVLLGVLCGAFGTALSYLILNFVTVFVRPMIGSIATPRPVLMLWPVLATAAIFEVSYLLCWRRLRKLDNTAVARGGE
ncbi:protein of unknown function DUF214 [Coriobacterium glomerans PW2]|uniref:ABC3 transporter permease protein domain-containing protein n=1 Tax=Coriobacterium glomerans (strain ATCC 49209 / DSM 20642 / JCM 10262 / PW2) TaxID=700015 RepID=F2N749_CORGP|nr:FtsX-like permease family protein [Coriobacterium glomerans]AEB06388.1 protein of unknown function DUF214 [Coriobacterium glomerans PW2]